MEGLSIAARYAVAPIVLYVHMCRHALVGRHKLVHYNGTTSFTKQQLQCNRNLKVTMAAASSVVAIVLAACNWLYNENTSLQDTILFSYWFMMSWVVRAASLIRSVHT